MVKAAFLSQPNYGDIMDEHKPNSPVERLHKLPIPVSVRVCGRSLTLDEFLNWVPGTILSFDHSFTAPLEMCIGSQTVGEGQAVKIGPKIGLKLHRLGNTLQIDATTTETR